MNRLKLLSAALLLGAACLAAPAHAGTGVSVSIDYNDHDRHASSHRRAPSYGHDHYYGHAPRYYPPVVIYQPPRHHRQRHHGHPVRHDRYDRYDRYDRHHRHHDRHCRH